MNIYNILGALLISIPFVGLFLLASKDFGVKAAVGLYLTVFGIVVVVYSGCYLLKM